MKNKPSKHTVTLFLCGDVMIGRGIDQILPQTCGPILHEPVVKHAGAGKNKHEAKKPAMFEVSDKVRVLLFSFGSETGGIPRRWAAGEMRWGINMLEDFSEKTVSRITEMVRRYKNPGDFVILSVHWGPNWGYEVSREQQEFAHQLIRQAEVDIVHGHSSHHAKGMELYKEKLILYGCGDLLNDYEGIGGHQEYRPDLSLMYFLTIDCLTGTLSSLAMRPMRIRRFSLEFASEKEVSWMKDALANGSLGLGGGIDRQLKQKDGWLYLTTDFRSIH